MAKQTSSMNEDLMSALRDAGLADVDTRRVVIDVTAGALPVVYTERFTDPTGLVRVTRAMTGVQIERG